MVGWGPDDSNHFHVGGVGVLSGMATCLVVSVVYSLLLLRACRSNQVAVAKFRVVSCLPLAGGVRVYSCLLVIVSCLFVFVSIRVRIPPIRVRVVWF